MAVVQKKVDKSKEITIFIVRGKIASHEILDALKEFYEHGFTLNVLWDFTGAELPVLETEGLSPVLSKIIATAKSYAHLRKGGKTAFVLPDIFGYGVGRMYEILSELASHPIDHGVFRSMAEAMSWLGS